MKIYDEETEALVSSNLQAERDVREGRIDEVLALAEAEQKSRLLGEGGGGDSGGGEEE